MGKHLVLVGGGHAHLTVLLNLATYIQHDHRVTLYEGRLAFVLKDTIDRKFMRKFQVAGELNEEENQIALLQKPK